MASFKTWLLVLCTLFAIFHVASAEVSTHKNEEGKGNRVEDSKDPEGSLPGYGSGGSPGGGGLPSYGGGGSPGGGGLPSYGGGGSPGGSGLPSYGGGGSPGGGGYENGD